MSWTAAAIGSATNTGTRVFLEPERKEHTERLPFVYVPDKADIAGHMRQLVKMERFAGNFVLTYRRVD